MVLKEVLQEDERQTMMIEHTLPTTESEASRLYEDMQANSLTALWRIEEAIMPQQPRPKAIPWLWKWADLYDVAQRAGRLVPVERGGERRGIALRNPGRAGQPLGTPPPRAAVPRWERTAGGAAPRHTAHA